MDNKTVKRRKHNMKTYYFTLTGTKHHYGNDFIEKDMIITLEKEPDNECHTQLDGGDEDPLSDRCRTPDPAYRIGYDRVYNTADPHVDKNPDRHRQTVFSVNDRRNTKPEADDHTADDHLCETIIAKAEIAMVSDIKYDPDQTKDCHCHSDTDKNTL
jgi:hypothetical protein